MNNIDWNEAPEWATGHGLMNGGFGIEKVWFNAEQYQYQHMRGRGGYGPYPFGDGNAAIGEIHFQQHRPAPWSGEGLPPAGTVCEVLNNTLDRPEWERCTILFIGKFKAVYESESCHERVADVSESWMISFRPIRTPEQIAAEEREKAIEALAVELAGHWSSEAVSLQRETAAYLHDIGYRRVEQ